MADQFKNLMIGVFVTAAAGIVIFILMFLRPNIGDEGKILHVQFTDIDKLTIGTRVTYAGKPVGEVVGIEEVETGRQGPKDDNGHVFLYDLKLRVDSSVNVYNTDKIIARTSGLLGEKNVEISPYAPLKGQELKQIDDKTLFAMEAASVEDTLKTFHQVGRKVDKALDSITDIIDRFSKLNIVEKIDHAVENIESITGALNHPQELSETLANIHQISKRVNESWDNIDKAINEIAGTATTAHHIVNNIAEGKGTIGKLLNNDELYLRTNSIMSKVETTLDDINHYGLMFHSNKGWQRLRARRLNLLQELRTPQEFRNYFNDEINQITTSLSRVYMVLNDVGADPYCTDLLHNSEYAKVFAELIRRIGMMEEEVRLYNTQVMETTVHQTELGSPCLQ